MKMIAALVILSFASIALFSAEQIVITINDFSVESRDISYEFIGKGLSRLVASEIQKTGKVKLVERENLQRIIEEQEFSLSDLADQENQIKIGKLLSAQYIVMGEIIDMAVVILLSLRMVDVKTGEILWQDELQEKLTAYDFIGAYFACSILRTFGINPENATLAKLEKKEEKKEEAIVRLSEGIEAFDRGDNKKAKRDLKDAQALDPVNDVISEFLSKLESVSPKFRVETELYSYTYNPASLGFLEKDILYYWWSEVMDPPNVQHRPGSSEGQLTGDYYVSTFGFNYKIGYAISLSDRLGLAAEYLEGMYSSKAFQVSNLLTVGEGFANHGAVFSIGYRGSDNLSLGGTYMIWETSHQNSVPPVDPATYWAAGGGIMLKALEDALTFDISVMYTNTSMYYADTSELKILRGNMPLLVEATLTYELVNQILFAGLKGIGSIFIDQRNGHALRVIPVLEYRPLKFLFIRAGFEYSHLDQADKFTMGYGFLAGLTIKIWRFDVSVNLTYSEMPTYLLPGYTVRNFTILLGGSFTPLLFKRRSSLLQTRRG